LLANGVGLRNSRRLTLCIRGQARSYTGSAPFFERVQLVQDLANAAVREAVTLGLHSSLFGSIPGNNTSINPNRLKSVIREGYSRPIR
jgi:hypothetical protein